MADIIQVRRGTAAEWTAANTLLADGEWGLEKDTGKVKVGDGVTAWNSLAYWSGGGGAAAEQQDPPFAYKPAGQPIVLVLTGQSNAVGATTTPAQPFPPNANVFDWTTGGSGGVYSWQSPDLNAAQRADFNDLLVYTGMPLGGRGNIGWSAADALQRLTGRDVYVICVALNAQPIQEWYAGQPLAVELNAQVPAALAAVPNGPTTIDGFIWMQGEANLEIVSPTDYLPPKDYSAAFLTEVYDQFVTAGWIADRQTQVAICELSPGWGVYGAAALWQVQYDANEFFRVVSSYGLPVAGDNIHFLPYSLGKLGEIAANGFMAGPDPKLKNPPPYLEDLWDVDLETAPATDGQVLAFDDATGKWVPVDQSGGSGGGGTVDSVVGGTDISVDSTDPANPIVSYNGRQLPTGTVLNATLRWNNANWVENTLLQTSAGSIDGISETDYGPQFRLNSYSNLGASYIIMRKYRGTKASPQPVQLNEGLGNILWQAWDGNALQNNGIIYAVVPGAVSVGNVPVDIVFSTGSAGASERMRIRYDGKIGINYATPTARLDVRAGAVQEAAFRAVSIAGGWARMDFYQLDSGINTLLYLDELSQFHLRHQGGTAMIFYTNDIERMRIRSDGIVMGTWSNGPTSNPASKMMVLTQAQYDGIPTKDADTLYFIAG